MKAIAVFSGGLDSMLAASLIRSLGIEVLAVFFETPFFTSTNAVKSAKTLSLPIKIVDITWAFLDVLKNPKHGYGKNMNPCIDCHALMIGKAGELLETEKADFIVTGEVLGQRPMSQNKTALGIVGKESRFAELTLRPLSAKHLPPTLPEKKGWVRREDLLDFSGRSRKPQMGLARKFGINEYPPPAGGCRLTDKNFVLRLRDLLLADPELTLRKIELLKIGRHFRLGPASKLIVGRDENENQRIESLCKPGDLIFRTVSVPGPVTLLTGDGSPEFERIGAELTASYSDLKSGEQIDIGLEKNGLQTIIQAQACSKEKFQIYLLR